MYRTAGCVAGFGSLQWTHKLMLFKIPAMHPMRTQTGTTRQPRITRFPTGCPTQDPPPHKHKPLQNKRKHSRGAWLRHGKQKDKESSVPAQVCTQDRTFFFYGDDLIRSTRTAKERNATQRAQEHRY